MTQSESKNNHVCKKGEYCCFKSRAIFGEFRTPLMVTWLVKKGVVKSEIAAGRILLAVTLVSFALAILISSSFLFGFSLGDIRDSYKDGKHNLDTQNKTNPTILPKK